MVGKKEGGINSLDGKGLYTGGVAVLVHVWFLGAECPDRTRLKMVVCLSAECIE